MRAWSVGFTVGALCLVAASAALAHPGGLNRDGCHNDRKHGGYHCHRATSRSTPVKPKVKKKAAPKTAKTPAEVIEQLGELRDVACACATVECSAHAKADVVVWADSWIDVSLGQDDQTQLEKLAREIGRCVGDVKQAAIFDNAQVTKALSGAMDRIKACADARTRAKIVVHGDVSPDGSIRTVVVVDSPKDAVTKCVVSAVSVGAFEKTDAGGVFMYPIEL